MHAVWMSGVCPDVPMYAAPWAYRFLLDVLDQRPILVQDTLRRHIFKAYRGCMHGALCPQHTSMQAGLQVARVAVRYQYRATKFFVMFWGVACVHFRCTESALIDGRNAGVQCAVGNTLCPWVGSAWHHRAWMHRKVVGHLCIGSIPASPTACPLRVWACRYSK